MIRTLATTYILAASCAVTSSVDAQVRDTLARRDTGVRDTTIARLATVRVTSSILPIAGPAIGSGVPARTSIIQRNELERWNSRLLANAVAREPGTSLYDDLGSVNKPTLVTRGFTASPVVGLPQGVSVFVDGVPVNEPDAGQVNFDLLPLDHAEQIEILSGTASLLGPNSLGGAINIITRRGGPRSGGEVDVTSGSHQAYTAAASHGDQLPGGWRYYAGVGYSSERGWRQLTEAQQYNAFVNLGRSSETAGFNFQAFTAKSYAETAGSLPLSVYRTKPDSNLSSGDFEDLAQVHVAVSGHRGIAGGQGVGTLYFRHSDGERFNVNQEADPDVRSFSANRTWGGSADWRTGRAIGSAALGLRFGVGGSANATAVRIYGERIDPGLTTHVDSPIGKVDAYTLADYSVGRVTVSSGLRYDVVRVPFRNRLDAGRDTTSRFQRVSPRGGVSFAIGQGSSVYVSAGQSFRAPALIELACADPLEPCPLPFALGDDPPLRPVVATTHEVGARWIAGAIELSAAAYRTAVRNDIFLFPYDDAGAPNESTIDGYFANVDATRREGVELGVRASAGPFTTSAAYAYTRATFQVDDVQIFSIREEAAPPDVEVNVIERGDHLPLIPRHTASLGASLDLGRGIQLGLDARHVGERRLRGDEANEESPLPGHTVIDVRAGYTFGNWQIAGIVRNVASADYATFGTFNINQGAGGALERFLTPGTPRTFQLILRRRLGAESGTS